MAGICGGGNGERGSCAERTTAEVAARRAALRMAVLNFTEHLGRNGRDGMKLPSGEKKITTGRAVLPDSRNFNPRRGNLAADNKKRAPREQGALWSNKISGDQTVNELPQPQVLLTLGLLNLKPAPSSVSM